MRTKTTKPKSRDEVIKELTNKRKMVEEEKQNDLGSQRAYVNLPLTLLERTFFDVVAKEVYGKDQTKLLRSIIRKLMVRHPECVEKAKQRIDGENG